MHHYPQLAARLYNTPLMIAESKFTVIEGVFRAWEGGDPSRPGPDAAARLADQATAKITMAAGIGTSRRYADKPYQMTDTGIAIIPIMGSLVQRASGLDAMSGLTSYASLTTLLGQAFADPDVRGVLQWYDTPGGEVAGLFALGDLLMAQRGGKPTLAYVDEQALSAGYYLAATADEIWMPTTGFAGSIGSVFMHREQSARNAAQGYVYTLIRSGAEKASGNPHEPLNDTALQWFQGEADRLRLLFAAHVDTARGLTAGTAAATEARVYAGPAAVDQHLVDTIGSFGDAVARLETLISTRTPGSTGSPAFPLSAHAATRKESPMSTPENGATATTAFTADQLAALKATAHAEGLKAGATAERTRIGAILGAEQAKGRATLAQAFALESDMDATTALKLLAASPVEEVKAQATNPLAAAMAGVENPAVGAGGNSDPTDASPEAQAKALALQIINAGRPSQK